MDGYFVFFLYILDQWSVMSDEQDSSTEFVDRNTFVSDTTRGFFIDISCRFISNQKFWITNKCSSNSYSLFFSTTKSTWFFPENMMDINEITYRFKFFFNKTLWQSIKFKWIGDIVLNSLPVKEFAVLKDNTKVSSILLYLSCRVPCDIITVMEDSSFWWSQLSHYKFCNSSLPNSTFSDNKTKISRMKIKRDIRECFMVISRIRPVEWTDTQKRNCCFLFFHTPSVLIVVVSCKSDNSW